MPEAPDNKTTGRHTLLPKLRPAERTTIMNDMTREEILASIVPKSDQINFDDLISGPITVEVAGVSAGTAEQPVNIRLVGEKRYYRPSKSMRRLLVAMWGDDGHAWVGRSMTLYGDPAVAFGGVQVGGIKISHMSNIDKPTQVLLTVTRGKKKPHEVKPLGKPDRDPDLVAHNQRNARQVAEMGTTEFKKFYKALSTESRDDLKPIMDELQQACEAADANTKTDDPSEQEQS